MDEDALRALDAKLTKVWWSVWALIFVVLLVGLSLALLLTA